MTLPYRGLPGVTGIKFQAAAEVGAQLGGQAVGTEDRVDADAVQ